MYTQTILSKILLLILERKRKFMEHCKYISHVIQLLFTKVGHHYYSDKQVHINVRNSVCVNKNEIRFLYGDYFTACCCIKENLMHLCNFKSCQKCHRNVLPIQK